MSDPIENSAAESKSSLTKVKLNASSKAFMEMFGLDYPIVQAAPGGERLAAAVANAEQWEQCS